ncbi:hypothetical protein KP509_01G053500 [Ceratopteris richardii]|uniref:Uncharacterized protein n=1 Tax=Ceratopteris richardii TaxID=49495 RepID=A0A8T2VGN2_CERRI|nr:hypothetical protein KP509_01G053500 [Ceratopteris richardii]
MLLRTSSAPALGALYSCFSTGDTCKESLDFQHIAQGSFFQPLSSSSSVTRVPQGTRAGEDAHAGLGNERESTPILRPPRMSRVRSEGDLARSPICIGSTAYVNRGRSGSESSACPEIDKAWKIPSQMPMCNSSPLQNGSSYGSVVDGHEQKFVLSDGEIYTSLTLNAAGSPLACNNKGCRPLTDPECKQLGFLDMASGIGCSSLVDAPVSHDSYYQSLLETDPGNPLLLRNYAEYLLKNGEAKKAEEFYERAILADPNDGEVLSSYAKLQWDSNRDEERAEAYYDRAVRAAPDDCFVMASYASFLWDVEEDEVSCAACAVPPPGAQPPAPSPLMASA